MESIHGECRMEMDPMDRKDRMDDFGLTACNPGC